MNVGFKQFAASGSRSGKGTCVGGWEQEQAWLIQKTREKNQYTFVLSFLIDMLAKT